MALLLGLLWGLQLLAGYVIAALGGLNGPQAAWWAALAAVVAFAPVLGLAHGLSLRSGQRPWTWLPPQRQPLWWWIGLLLSATGGSLVLGALSSALGLVWPMNGLQELMAKLAPARFSLASLVLFGVVAPLTEESLFRGYFLGSATLRYGRFPAIFLTASLFAVAHGNPWQGIPALIAGVYLAAVVPRGGLVSALAAHALFNVFPLLLRWGGFEIPGINDFSTVIPPFPWLFTGCLLLGGGLTLGLLVTQKIPKESSSAG